MKGEDEEVGFSRPEFGTCSLGGSAKVPDKHVFLVHGTPALWQAKLENADGPIKQLSSALEDANVAVKVTAVEGLASVDEDGDVLVYPDNVRIRGVSPEQYDTLARGILENDLTSFDALPLHGSQVYVCTHGSRDMRCGFCGPKLIEAITAEADSRSTEIQIRGCAHIGGHRYAGNAILFRQGKVADWLGYLSPTDAAYLVDLCESPEAPVKHSLWRGRMGVPRDEHKRIIKDIEDAGSSVNCDCGVENADPETNEDATVSNVLFVLGGPGSGKGTLSKGIERELPFTHLSAGELLRQEQQNKDSKNGALIKSFINSGKIVPVDITVQLLLREMQRSSRDNFLIDGFPRNQDNLDGWNRVVGNKANVCGVLFLDAPADILTARLLKRSEIEGRSDDNVESIRKRLNTFRMETLPVVKQFQRQGLLHKVRADQTPEKVLGHVRQLLQTKILKQPPQNPRVPRGYGALAIGTIGLLIITATVFRFRKKA